MRYTLPRDSQILSNAALGPAAMADRARRSALMNMGIPQQRLTTAELMKRGGSFGSFSSIDYMIRGDRRFGGLGSVAYAEQGFSEGASVGGMAYGPIGAAIGAIAGGIIGLIAHQGQAPQRAAAAQQIDAGLAAIPSTAGVGVQIPWIGSSTAPGLQQYLQAIMTSGLFMNWDPSLVSSPAVNGNWANTFITAVKQLVAAIIKNPTGANVSLNITDKPGGNDAVAGTFNFINPGLQVGPDAISQSLIMGNGGLMYWMILRTGESTAHAMANASSAAAQKVFALMVDHAAHDLAPQLFTPAPPPATISTVANAAIAATPALATPQPTGLVTTQTSNVQPLPAIQVALAPVSVASDGSLVASTPLPIDTTTGMPIAIPAPAGTDNTWLYLRGAAGLAYVLLS
jgi:hypothetical protein